MIIGVSIVDMHRPAGDRHVGTYVFEIPYDGDSHFDIVAMACPVEMEETLRADGLNRLLKKADMSNPVNLKGERVA